MSTHQQTQIERIRNQYAERKPTEFEQLKALDKKVKRPAEVFAYVFGSVGALVLGTGMCLAMKVIGDAMALGIAIGLVGIGMVSVTYSLYQKLLRGRKQKYAAEILELSDGLLNE